MPIYEFECTACATVFDRLQKLSDPDPVECPECGKPKLKRRLTAPSFRLAGSGWYETDFKKEGDKQRNLVGKDEAPKADTKPDGKPDSKPESKPESKSETKESTKESTKSATPAAAAPASSKPDSGA